MKVSFNPVKQNYNKSFEGKFKNKEDIYHYYDRKPTKDEILTAKTKKAVSECKYIVFGAGILYFAMKRNFKVNGIKSHERKLFELSKMKVPPIDLLHKI